MQVAQAIKSMDPPLRQCICMLCVVRTSACLSIFEFTLELIVVTDWARRRASY